MHNILAYNILQTFLRWRMTDTVRNTFIFLFFENMHLKFIYHGKMMSKRKLYIATVIINDMHCLSLSFTLLKPYTLSFMYNYIYSYYLSFNDRLMNLTFINEALENLVSYVLHWVGNVMTIICGLTIFNLIYGFLYENAQTFNVQHVLEKYVMEQKGTSSSKSLGFTLPFTYQD